MNEPSKHKKMHSPTPNKQSSNHAITFLTLTACVALGFWQWQQQKHIAQWHAQIQAQTKTIEALHSTLTHLQHQAHAPEKVWRIQQAYDYAKMAQVKCLWEYQPKQAKALLKLSLDTLMPLDAPELKNHLQNNINQLRIPDQKTIDQAILDTKKQIGMLQLTQPTMTLNIASDQSPPVKRNWRDRIQEKLNQAVIIRHTGETLKPMLSEAQYNVLRANLTVNLDMAQLSLMHQDVEGFQHNIDHCLLSLTAVPQNESSRRLSKQLQALKAHITSYQYLDFQPLLKAFEQQLSQVTQDKLQESPPDHSAITSDDNTEVGR